MRSNIIYLDSLAGVAGDMFVSAFLHAGLVTQSELQSLIERDLGLLGVSLNVSKVNKAGIECLHLDVEFEAEGPWKKVFPGGKVHQHNLNQKHDHHHHGEHSHDHDHDHAHSTLSDPNQSATQHGWHTHYSDLRAFLEKSKLGVECKALALKILKTLAQAEARVHGMADDEVLFHEVGTVDSLVDVVCAAFCVTKIHPLQIYASPVKLGHGFQRMEHGLHAIPAPAALILSEGMEVAALPIQKKFESSTPTGLSILKALNPSFTAQMPDGKVVTHGYGAGTKDLGEFPNVFRVVVMSCSQSLVENIRQKLDHEEVVEVVCNLDDMNPEHLAWLSAKLVAAESEAGFGCFDVWQMSYAGKKGRMGIELHAICSVDKRDGVIALIFECSTTFGVRYQTWDRLILRRDFERRQIDGNSFNVKVGYDGAGRRVKEKPEFDDIAKTLDERARSIHAIWNPSGKGN